ncbi:MAG: CRISPR-associated endonuclease Cas2 [Lactobacillales bacterium]|jgi:CRISPR-associated protein Cas2|nr:CRISPR-associated endonuclease Cas2 [Lactobacillales bacterium]
MLVLICYDVNTETKEGRSRLRKIAKECVNYGQRVQNSVFECHIDEAKFREVKEKMLQIIDNNSDSLRFYRLGNHYKNKIEYYGVDTSFDVTDTLIL